MPTLEELNKHTSVLQTSINELLETHKTLQTFQDAHEWDTDAQALTGLLQKFKDDWESYRKEQETLLGQLAQEHDSKSFVKKVFSSRSNEVAIQKSIEQVSVEVRSIDNVVEELTELMDKTPADKSEQKEIVEEIKELKKELVLAKREINNNLRQTRATARNKTANFAGVRGGMLGSVARYNRVSIRMQKERALVPMEQQKTFVEKKLISLERDLSWVNHFKGDNLKSEEEPLQEVNNVATQRCNYCGRRVSESDEVCKGCGAIV